MYKSPNGDFSLFVQEFLSFILMNETLESDVINLADVNIWVDDNNNDNAQLWLIVEHFQFSYFRKSTNKQNCSFFILSY